MALVDLRQQKEKLYSKDENQDKYSKRKVKSLIRIY